MQEGLVPAVPGEARPMGSAEPAGEPGGRPIDDPRALQILSTEHWSLLTARSLVYNEAFARAGMFLAFLSATLLVLGLISTATGFSDGFLIVTAVVLALDLFVGLTTLGRIGAASNEDIRFLQGMNRLRNAYHDMVPGLEKYFIAGKYDDIDSAAAVYGSLRVSPLRQVVHGFTTAPAMITVIVSAVAGGLVAVVSMLVTHDGAIAGLLGAITFMVAVAVGVMTSIRLVKAFGESLEVRFPPPPADDPGR